MAQQPTGFEYKHVECPQIASLVDVVTNDHAMFYWEMTGTQTVVSRESHLEGGGILDVILDLDTLYSVTTAERFVALDFRRAYDIPNLQRIKEVEREYFRLCVSLANLGASPLDNYSTHTPPPKEINWIALGCLSLLYILPGVFYYIWKEKKHKEAIAQRANEINILKPRLDNLLQRNREILNIAI